MSAGDDLSTAQSVAFAVLYALDHEPEAEWTAWAHGWLKGDDRSGTAAQAAAQVARMPASRHAAIAAALLDETQSLQTEAAMLTAEGRNDRWTLDAAEERGTRCLVEVAEAIRLAGGDTPRSAELLTHVRRTH